MPRLIATPDGLRPESELRRVVTFTLDPTDIHITIAWCDPAAEWREPAQGPLVLKTTGYIIAIDKPEPDGRLRTIAGDLALEQLARTIACQDEPDDLVVTLEWRLRVDQGEHRAGDLVKRSAHVIKREGVLADSLAATLS